MRHRSLLLNYDEKEMSVPEVGLLGEELYSIILKNLAQKHLVPIVEDDELISKLIPGKPIPEEYYQKIANLLVKLENFPKKQFS